MRQALPPAPLLGPLPGSVPPCGLASGLAPGAASAQLDIERPEDREADQYAALSADQRAQLSLGAFRAYLERTREVDDGRLYRALDPRLDDLEERTLAADAVFWTGAGLSVAAVAAGIPLYAVFDDPASGDPTLQDLGLGLMIGGAATFLVAVIIQAVLRPGQDDLVALIDLHDEQLGRR